MSDYNQVINDLADSFGDFKNKYDGRIEALTTENKGLVKALDSIEKQLGRRSTGSSGSSDPAANEHKTAFLGWVRKGLESGLAGLELQAGLRTNSDPDGGYGVPEQLDTDIDRVASDEVAMRRIANVIVVESGDYKRPFSRGGAAGGWVGETDDRDETATPSLDLFAPAWQELYALPKVTQKLLDLAAFDVERWLIDELTTTEIELEGAAFITGNGVKQPKGILSYDTVANQNWEPQKVGFVVSGAAAGITPDGLIDLQHAAKPVHRRNGTWLMNDLTWAAVRKLKDGDGNYLWRPGLDPDAPDVLLGKPVEIDDNMPSIEADACPVAFGDFKRGYTIGDHAAGRRLLRDPFTLKGWVKFYLVKRTFGGLYNHQAIKLLKVAA